MSQIWSHGSLPQIHLALLFWSLVLVRSTYGLFDLCQPISFRVFSPQMVLILKSSLVFYFVDVVIPLLHILNYIVFQLLERLVFCSFYSFLLCNVFDCCFVFEIFIFIFSLFFFFLIDAIFWSYFVFFFAST